MCELICFFFCAQISPLYTSSNETVLYAFQFELFLLLKIITHIKTNIDQNYKKKEKRIKINSDNFVFSSALELNHIIICKNICSFLKIDNLEGPSTKKKMPEKAANKTS